MLRESSTSQRMSKNSIRNDAEKADSPKALRLLVPYLGPYKGAIAGAVIALLIVSVTMLGIGRGLQYLIDQAFVTGDAGTLNQALIVLFGVVGILSMASFARLVLIAKIGEGVVRDLRQAIYSHLTGLDISFFEMRNTGELIARFTNDTTLLQVVVGTSLPIALRNGMLLMGGLAMMLTSSMKLTLAVMVIVPLILLPIILLGKHVRSRSKLAQEAVGDVGAHLDENLHAVREIQAFAREHIVRRQFSVHAQKAFDSAIRFVRTRACLSSSIILITFSCIGVVLWLGGHEVLDGNLTPGQLSSFVFYALLVAASVGALSEVYGDLLRAAGAADRLFEILAVKPKIVSPLSSSILPVQPKSSLAFHNVSFFYPSRPDTPALKDVNFVIQPGELVALVGPSGAGKSTIFQLIERFYDPQHGSVCFDDVDIRELDLYMMRSVIGMVPQDPVIFSSSAAENIAFGREKANFEMIQEAAKAAYIHDFIMSLPDGYDTPLGERGTRLSGGQAQRIALARAILRDPALLLLDEATSALDSESERMVQKALDSLMKDRTTLVIAHRLSTVQHADRILVIDNGEIVDSGKHHELIKKGGLYARLAAMQFQE